MLERANVRTQIIKMIKDHLGIDKELNDETTLDSDLEADSLDRVELVMAIEEDFNIHVTDDEMEGIRTIGELTNFVLTKASELQKV